MNSVSRFFDWLGDSREANPAIVLGIGHVMAAIIAPLTTNHFEAWLYALVWLPIGVALLIYGGRRL